MGFPSEGVESMYRNKMKDTQDFLAHYHGVNYKVGKLLTPVIDKHKGVQFM